MERAHGIFAEGKREILLNKGGYVAGERRVSFSNHWAMSSQWAQQYGLSSLSKVEKVGSDIDKDVSCKQQHRQNIQDQRAKWEHNDRQRTLCDTPNAPSREPLKRGFLANYRAFREMGRRRDPTSRILERNGNRIRPRTPLILARYAQRSHLKTMLAKLPILPAKRSL